MPHQCTNCGKLFGDGSKEMLSGCPNCGNNKFQFQPEEVLAGGDGSTSSTARERGSGNPSEARSADDAERADATRDSSEGDESTSGEWPDPDGAYANTADRRRNPEADTPDDAGGTSPEPDVGGSPDPPHAAEPDNADQPGLSDLREELNNQFESIKIVSPGKYELNLMELYDRDEYIISLQEDGRYVIEVPDAWNRDDEN